jgi:hypothetical protein
MTLPIHNSDVELLVRAAMGTSMVALAEEAGCTPPNIARKVKRIKERLSWTAGMTVEQIRQRAGAVKLAGRSTGPEVLKLIVERDQFKAEVERLRQFETAYMEWSDKSDWARVNSAPAEWGKHLADVIKGRVDALTAEVEALRKELAAVHPFKPNGDQPTIGYTGCLICGKYTDHQGLPCPQMRAFAMSKEAGHD